MHLKAQRHRPRQVVLALRETNHTQYLAVLAASCRYVRPQRCVLGLQSVDCIFGAGDTGRDSNACVDLLVPATRYVINM